MQHVGMEDHQQALKASVLRQNLLAASRNATSKQEKAVTIAMKVVYWLAKEGIATVKFESLVNMCRSVGSEDLGCLGDLGRNTTYTFMAIGSEQSGGHHKGSYFQYRPGYV